MVLALRSLSFLFTMVVSNLPRGLRWSPLQTVICNDREYGRTANYRSAVDDLVLEERKADRDRPRRLCSAHGSAAQDRERFHNK
jgi:hypothetical protein